MACVYCEKHIGTSDYVFCCEHFYSAVRHNVYLEYRLSKMVEEFDSELLFECNQYS